MSSHVPAETASLICRECGAEGPLEGPQYCEVCFGPLEVVWSPASAVGAELRRLVSAGGSGIGRFAPLLPSCLDLGAATSGSTPLRRAERLGDSLGLDDLWLKDETANPTGSFKDRVVEVASCRAVSTGARVLACSSTGNLARAVAATARRLGCDSVVLVPRDMPTGHARELTELGARVVAVSGPYDAASRLAAEAAAELPAWGWVNVTLRPWYELGARTLGWEIAEQLGWGLPDRIAAPVASGAMLRAVHEAFESARRWGLAAGEPPRVTALQPAGCAPVVAAFAAGDDRVVPVHPDTVVTSLAMGDPPDGGAVAAAARRTGGVVAAAAEREVAAAVDLLRRCEGIAADLAVGVVVAGLAGLVREGEIRSDERVVAVVSGAAPPPPGLSVVVPGETTTTIEPSLSALMAVLPEALRSN